METIVSTSVKKRSQFKLGLLCCILLAAFLFYVLNATTHGLWYDEAIEYFYSKHLTGTVPGGLGTTNMLERIRITYQPPLYNILMYVWLSIFDSELSFRLAGILITIAGSVGVYLAINEVLPDGIWSDLGTLFYLFSYGTVYYALECAEYNLMMCFTAWSVFFFLRLLMRNDRKSVIGFFAFSCLSVYSQYGATFIVFGMSLALLIHLITTNNTKQLRLFVLSGIGTAVLAILPLAVFFLYPQMKHLNSGTVSHTPFFARGLVVDFFVGGKDTLESMFGQRTVYVIILLLAISLISLALCFKRIIYPFLALFFAWIVYFFAVCCSFYGNKIWDTDSIGSMNLGDRYSFFFIPATVTMLTIGLWLLWEYMKQKDITLAKIWVVICSVCIAMICSYEIYRTASQTIHKPDDDVRELVLFWYDHGLYDSKTLLFQWDDALFNYYLIHDDRYQRSYSLSVESTDVWARTADYDEMYTKLSEMGYLSSDEFYYVTSRTKDNPVFLSVMKDAEYDVQVVYSGESILLHLTNMTHFEHTE